MIYRKSAAPEPLERGLTPDQRFELAKTTRVCVTVAVTALILVLGIVGVAAYADSHRACTEEKR